MRQQIIWRLYLLILLSLSISPVYAAGEGMTVYNNTTKLTETRKQKLADDISTYRNADNIWDALRDEFTLPHYENNPAVRERIQWYMNNQGFLLRTATRAAPYLHYILQQVKTRHLPAELVLVPLIESGYNPFLTSDKGAAGIWQLMPETASGLGVQQDWWYDGRRDVVSSTRAALNYLAYLQTYFDGNWLLSIAAYNTGEGNILAAIKRNIKQGKGTDFWSLPLARETQMYVPSLLALAVIISRPDKYPVYFPPVKNAPYLASIDLGTQVNLKYAASLAGMSYRKLIELNPGYNRQSTAKKGPYRIILPIENVEQFSDNFSHSPIVKKTQMIEYTIKSGDNLTAIAERFNSSLPDIKKVNQLDSRNVKLGSTILIPLENRAAMPFQLGQHLKQRFKQVAHKKTKRTYKLQAGDTVYVVRDEDSIPLIADRFHLSTDAIIAANALSSDNIRVGERLVLPTHNSNS